MRGSLIILLVIVSLLLSISAEGADWELIRISNDRNVSVYIDTESIRHISKTVVRAWTKIIFEDPKPFLSKKLMYSLDYGEYDCAEMKHVLLQYYFKFSDGNSETSTNPAPEKDWEYIVPGSISSAVHDYLCKDKK